MSFHLAANTVLLGTVANTDIPPVVDDVLSIQNAHFILRKPMNLIAAAVMSATLSRVRYDSPTMRFYGNPFIRPIGVAALPPADPNVALYYKKPILLPAGEEIAIQATSAIAMGTERFTALHWLQDRFEALPAGNVYCVRALSTGTAVVNAWTTLAYTLDAGLPTGQFALVGSEVVSTNGQAHRWLFDEQLDRPGYLSHATLGLRAFWETYYQQFGVMGRFWNTFLPRLQVLANVADTAHEIYMYVVPLGRMV